MYHFRAFVAGLVLPGIILPIVLLVAMATGRGAILSVPFIHFLPVIWGIWNILYFAFFKEFLHMRMNFRLLITGAVLGFIVALVGVFWLHLPTTMGLPENFYYWPLLIAPIVYALLWRYAVKAFNNMLDLRDS